MIFSNFLRNGNLEKRIKTKMQLNQAVRNLGKTVGSLYATNSVNDFLWGHFLLAYPATYTL